MTLEELDQMKYLEQNLEGSVAELLPPVIGGFRGYSYNL